MSAVATSPLQIDEVVDPLNFTVTDVTGQRTLRFFDIDGYRTAGDLAASAAEQFGLPSETRYSLRDDVQARMLLDDRSVGQQVQHDENLRFVVIPKAHLG